MFICYDDESVIGKVKTEEEAREVCQEVGTSYRKTRPIFFFLNLSKDYTMNTKFGFLTYKEVIEKGREILKDKHIIKKDISLEEILLVFEEIFGKEHVSKVIEKKISKFI